MPGAQDAPQQSHRPVLYIKDHAVHSCTLYLAAGIPHIVQSDVSFGLVTGGHMLVHPALVSHALHRFLGPCGEVRALWIWRRDFVQTL